jgi:hypothetical protein
MSVERRKDKAPVIILVIVAVTVICGLAVYLDWITFLHRRVGPFYLHHWVQMAGTVFIAVYSPLYHFLKKRRIGSYLVLRNIHCFGGLLSLLLISGHFAHHISNPGSYYSLFRSGIILYLVVVALVVTGIVQRLRLVSRGLKHWRYFHVAVILLFYGILLFHLLQRFGIVKV